MRKKKQKFLTLKLLFDPWIEAFLGIRRARMCVDGERSNKPTDTHIR